MTVAARTVEDLRRQRDAAAAVADLVELRLDALERPEAAGPLSGRSGPVIATCRPAWEGGGFRGAEEARLAVLSEAANLGAEFVDVEWRAAFQPLLVRRGGKGIVLSMHDFAGVPADLAERYRAMRGAGAEVVKLAVAPRTLVETAALYQIGRRAGDRDRVSLIGMGVPGLPSRILAARFGSCWTYAGDEVAPGQVPAPTFLRDFRFRRVTATTDVYGVVGRPVSHSISPLLHNAAFDECGVDAVLLPLEAADALDFVSFARTLGVSGASVTAPFKVDLLRHADDLDGPAERAGALNTIRVKGGRWEGRNTDIPGFLAPLEGRVRLAGARVAVLGAGGAARAVAVALAGRGAAVTVHARRQEAALEVAALCGGQGLTEPPSAGEWDLLVNATTVGTITAGRGRGPGGAADAARMAAGRPGESEEMPVAESALRGGGLVYDLVYNPPRTALLRAAEAAGCRVLGGLDMLVAQAALQFEWWTGRAAPTRVMEARAGEWLRSSTRRTPVGEGEA